MKKLSLFVTGFLVSAVLFSSGIAYAAHGVLAERSTQAVYVDGQSVELEAYLIDGSNYVKLRDIGQAVNFNVYWDGAVRIESGAAYTGQPPVSVSKDIPMKPTEDYSLMANPEVFLGTYSREAYNAAYEVLTAARNGDDSQTASVYFSSYIDRQKFENLLARLANGTTLSMRGGENDMYEIYARKMDWSAADAATDGFVQEVKKLPSDREKIIRVNEWICDHIVYNPKVFVGVNEIANAFEPPEGNCASFANMMNYLCGRIGIPCIVVTGESHSWNMIWADGAWGYIDASLNDQVYGHAYLLFSSTPPKQPSDPEGYRFLMELLVPGTAK